MISNELHTRSDSRNVRILGAIYHKMEMAIAMAPHLPLSSHFTICRNQSDFNCCSEIVVNHDIPVHISYSHFCVWKYIWFHFDSSRPPPPIAPYNWNKKISCIILHKFTSHTEMIACCCFTLKIKWLKWDFNYTFDNCHMNAMSTSSCIVLVCNVQCALCNINQAHIANHTHAPIFTQSSIYFLN